MRPAKLLAEQALRIWNKHSIIFLRHNCQMFSTSLIGCFRDKWSKFNFSLQWWGLIIMVMPTFFLVMTASISSRWFFFLLFFCWVWNHNLLYQICDLQEYHKMLQCLSFPCKFNLVILLPQFTYYLLMV